MLKLNLKRTPAWHDLGHGVRILCAPATTSVLGDARRAPEVLALQPEPAEDGGAPRMDAAMREALALAMARAIAQAVILDWEGVGDDEGNPLPPTPDGITALLDLRPMFEAFQVCVVAPGMMLWSEKNGSAPSRNGTTAGAPITAPRARDAAATARRH